MLSEAFLRFVEGGIAGNVREEGGAGNVPEEDGGDPVSPGWQRHQKHNIYICDNNLPALVRDVRRPERWIEKLNTSKEPTDSQSSFQTIGTIQI